MVVLFQVVKGPGGRREQEIDFSTFLQALENGAVMRVTIQGNNISGQYVEGELFRTYAPDYPDLVKVLRETGVRIEARPKAESPLWQSFLFGERSH